MEKRDPDIDAGEALLGEHRLPRARRIALAYVLMAAVQFLFLRLSGLYAIAVAFGVMGTIGLVRPYTVVTREGVRLATVRPWRRWIAFSDIVAVLTPSATSQSRRLRLQLRDDEIVTIGFVGAERAAALAWLAGVAVGQLEDWPPPRPVPLAVEDPDRPLSEAELAIRFAKLQQGAAKLAAELRRPTGEG